MLTSRNFERTSSNISYLSINQPTILPSIYLIYISNYLSIYLHNTHLSIYLPRYLSIYLFIQGELLDLSVLCLPLHCRGLSETSYTTPRYKIRFIEIEGNFSKWEVGGGENVCGKKSSTAIFFEFYNNFYLCK